jgi:RNA-binding protein PNO1
MTPLADEHADQTELTKEDRESLMQFETLNNQQIEFDKAKIGQKKKTEFRRIPVPLHRYTPLKTNWETILKTLVKHMKLIVRMNTKRRAIELKATKDVKDTGTIQKASDFLKAFLLGFELQDAVAILRLEDLHIQTFEIKDVKILRNDHLPRCIGRICGEKGKTKNAVENATRTRIVVADTRIHILGSFANIQYAKSAV